MRAAPRHRSRGHSVMEALLVIVLFFLALSMIATLFLYANRFSSAGGERTEIAHARLIAADQLRRAMAGSYQSGNTACYQSSANTDLVLSLISTVDAEGQKGWDSAEQKPLFQGYQIFYLDVAGSQLKTFRAGITTTTTAEPLSPPDLLTRISGGPGRVLLSGVTTFQLFSLQDGQVLTSWANPVGLRLIQSTRRGTPVVTEIPFKFPSL